MISSTLKSAAVAAAAFCLASAASAGTLVVGYSADPSLGGGVALLNGADLTSTGVTQSVGDVATGLAWGAGSLFVANDATPNAYLQRFNTSLDSIDVGTLPAFGFGQMAYGADTLFVAADGFVTHGVFRFDNDLNFIPGFIDLGDTVPAGLAFGDDSLFVAYDSVMGRYDATGALLASYDFGPFFDFDAIAYGDGKLYAGLTFAGIGGDLFGVLEIDPFNLSTFDVFTDLDSEVKGMAFGDGGLFVGLEHSVAKYAPDGSETASLDLGALYAGPLTFIPSPDRPDHPCNTRVCEPGGAVPEPGAWAMMILGFGMSGAILRARRRPVPARG